MNRDYDCLQSYKGVKKIVKSDGVIAFPTETVYGLGIKYDSFLAYQKLFNIKKRTESKQLTLMLHEKNDIQKYAIIDKNAQNIIDTFMPGPLTIVLPKRKDVSLIGNSENIGIRIPDHKQTLELLKAIGVPMYVTSANISNHDDCLSYEQVKAVFNDNLDFIIKGEACGKIPSTVISIIEGKVELLREGPIDIEEIKGVYYR